MTRYHHNWSAEVRDIFSILENNVRLVGGCVRDALLERPISDIDLATPILPQDVIKAFNQKNIKVIPTGIDYGTVTVVLNNKNFEITTLREDISTDGRRANVVYSHDWKKDAMRRDFTINALYSSLDGEIYDYFDGLEDLKQGIVKFVGVAEERCNEDILRILRFFRFSAYYSKHKLDDDGLAACKKLAHKIHILSGERIKTEMLKLLVAKSPLPIIEKMIETSIIFEFMPRGLDIELLENLIELEKNNKILTSDPILRLAAMLSVADANLVSEHWKLSNKQKDELLLLSRKEDVLKEKKKCLRRLGREMFEKAAMLSCADKGKFDIEAFDLARSWKIPKFPLGGNDLQALNILPGKEMGELLRKAETWWESNDYIATKDEIINFLRK